MDKQTVLRLRASAPVPITRDIASWDMCDMVDAEVKYQMSEEYLADHPDDRGLSEDKVRESVYNSDISGMWWDDVCDNLTSDLKKISPTLCFRVEVTGFGWQKRSGYKYVKVNNARELLSKILPDTDCTWHMFKVKHGKKLALANAHHDAPMLGQEWYVIKPCAESACNV